jgi:hypothetical protein
MSSLPFEYRPDNYLEPHARIVFQGVSTQPQAATHWLVRDLFKLTAEASAAHLSSYFKGYWYIN